jgi:hypothetical protein
MIEPFTCIELRVKRLRYGFDTFFYWFTEKWRSNTISGCGKCVHFFPRWRRNCGENPNPSPDVHPNGRRWKVRPGFNPLSNKFVGHRTGTSSLLRSLFHPLSFLFHSIPIPLKSFCVSGRFPWCKARTSVSQNAIFFRRSYGLLWQSRVAS